MVSEKVKLISKIYYSNPEVQKQIFEFSKNREVVPRYTESFGKRPDSLQYQSDFQGLINKGATSLHASEEIWKDPFKIDSEMSSSELSELRDSWDLLIDIDTAYLDYSKTAAKLILNVLEEYGIKNYGIKFSGSRGFHIIVPAKAFPEKFNNKETKKMFPEWPRTISEFILHKIRKNYGREISKLNINFKALEERTKLSKQDLMKVLCPNCGFPAEKGKIAFYECNRCKNQMQKPNPKSKRKLKCTEESCPGFYELKEEKEYFKCEKCGFSSFDKRALSAKKTVFSRDLKNQKFSEEFKEELSADRLGSLDLALVSSRHLFRMPYSLHEKTALASVVLKKEELDSFSPKDADPLKVKIRNFYPSPEKNEAEALLTSALSWKESFQEEEPTKRVYKKIDIKGIKEEYFPKPIKKLLKGNLRDGKKRGLFVLITFLKSLNFPEDYITPKITEWNKKNDPPLKEGYIKSQLNWHLRQKKQILPPNYKNESFYKDLNLLDSTPTDKNPISEILRKIKNK